MNVPPGINANKIYVYVCNFGPIQKTSRPVSPKMWLVWNRFARTMITSQNVFNRSQVWAQYTSRSPSNAVSACHNMNSANLRFHATPPILTKLFDQCTTDIPKDPVRSWQPLFLFTMLGTPETLYNTFLTDQVNHNRFWDIDKQSYRIDFRVIWSLINLSYNRRELNSKMLAINSIPVLQICCPLRLLNNV